ncbi:MAG: tryptophan synthase subunit alpha [Endomicrobium sp.]|jgi:tryptophan synthase alpha chain|nr:tryptophan synthase subunit alpha [Endomicrobium sp.]
MNNNRSFFVSLPLKELLPRKFIPGRFNFRYGVSQICLRKRDINGYEIKKEENFNLLKNEMNISEIFKNKKVLITYLTAGDPSLDKTEDYILAMAENGADIIEIGIPFSDPIAEGKTIQNAMSRALSKNINLDYIFNMVVNVKKKSKIPLMFMTYLNPLLSYGYERFFKRCRWTGISGIIIPDMPFEEQGEIKEFTDKYGIAVINLIAPTSEERINILAKQAKGFIYLVSSLGVTGMRNRITTDISAIVSKIKKATDTPIAVGFGISSAEQAKDMAKLADGVIIGSAIVKIIAENKENTAAELAKYVSDIKRSICGL